MSFGYIQGLDLVGQKTTKVKHPKSTLTMCLLSLLLSSHYLDFTTLNQATLQS